jgi:hypothetical protein
VAAFKVHIDRTFVHDGKRRSYINAKCPVPETFTAGFVSFARATYTFEDDRELTTEAVRSCRVRRPSIP